MISQINALNAIASCSMARLSVVTDSFISFFSFDKDEDIREVKQRLKGGLYHLNIRWKDVKVDGDTITFNLK